MKLIKINSVRGILSNDITLSGISSKDLVDIKKSLTFENPAYETVQRYSKYAYTTVPPYLIYYEESKNTIRVPIGYDLKLLKNLKLEDRRVTNKVNIAPFVLTLRASQEEAVNNYLSDNEDMMLKGCIQMPTGKGKSILGLYIAQALSTKTLVIVHKNDLVTGWQEDIKLAFNNKVNSGLIKAKSRKIGNFITIATIQTLNKLSNKELEELYNTFGLVILDEMHHCAASSFDLVAKFNSRYKLGLTATPERNDGLAHVMTLYFGDFCYKYKLADGEKEEDILPVQVIVKKSSIYLNPLCKEVRAGDNRVSYKILDLNYPEHGEVKDNQKRLSEVPYGIRPRVSFQTLDNIVVNGIKDTVIKDIINEYNLGRSCVVFFTQKEHIRLYHTLLTELIPEDSIGLYYGDNNNNDEVKIKAENTRKFITLTTYAKATEGTNVKQWEVEFLVSSINNEKNTEQALGRIRRTKEGHKIDPVIVYDYRTPNVYSFASHGSTRDKRYRKLGCELGNVKQRSLFSRGFK